MITGEMARLAFESIRAHKLRSFLNLLGVIIAVTTLVAVVSIVNGLNEYAANVINQLGPNTFIATKIGIVQSRSEFLAANRRKDITLEDVEAVARLVPEAKRVTPRVFSTAAVYAEGRRLPDTFVVGTGPEFPFMVGMELDDGRYFSATEAGAARPVAVIGWDVKDELFPHVDPIGRLVKLGGKPFRVVGLLVRQGRLLGQSQDKVVVIPFLAYQKAFGKSRSVDIFVESPGPEATAAVLDGVRSVLRARRGTAFDAPDPYDIVDAQSLQRLWSGLTSRGFQLVIWIAGISLVVGGVAIANTMFASIVERTREIGIRKSLGARRRDVRRQFLFESAALSTTGGAIGVALGWLAAWIVDAATPFPAAVDPWLVVAGLVLATVSGVLAGWLPALRASRLDPVAALREE